MGSVDGAACESHDDENGGCAGWGSGGCEWSVCIDDCECCSMSEVFVELVVVV